MSISKEAFAAQLVKLFGYTADLVKEAIDAGHLDEMQAVEVAFIAGKVARFGKPGDPEPSK